MKKKIIILVIIIIIAAAAIAVFLIVKPVAPGLEPVAQASYSCDGGKTIAASFYTNPEAPASPPGAPPVPGGSAVIKLGDGRNMTLAQTVSADGARYANSDESFVFWSKGYGAFVMENNTTTYADCLQNLPTESFVNAAGGYQFEVPNVWSAVVNGDDQKNSLFGPDASGTAGLGGVEVFPGQKSIQGFLNGVAASYSNRQPVAVDGIQGLQVSYQSSAGSGEQVVLLKNGTIYNIYIGSTMDDDLGFFKQITGSFTFAQ